MIPIKGLISLLLYIINFVVQAIIIIIAVFLMVFIPTHAWRLRYQRDFLQRMPETFWAINSLIMHISTRNRWDIAGSGSLKRAGWYVMISNHQSWTDILVLSKVFGGKIPPLKF